MKNIDTYLLDKFQAFSDWFQDMTGKTCFWLAMSIVYLKLMINVYSWICFGWQAYSVVTTLIGFTGIFYAISNLQSFSSGNGFANPLKHHPISPYLRAIGLGAMLGSVWGILEQVIKNESISKDTYSWINGILIFFIIYLIFCSPRPGGKYKAGKWLDAVARALFGKFSPQGT